MWWPEALGTCFIPLHLIPLRYDLTLNLCLARPNDPPEYFLTITWSARVRYTQPYPDFYVVARDSSSGTHTCIASPHSI